MSLLPYPFLKYFFLLSFLTSPSSQGPALRITPFRSFLLQCCIDTQPPQFQKSGYNTASSLSSGTHYMTTYFCITRPPSSRGEPAASAHEQCTGLPTT